MQLTWDDWLDLLNNIIKTIQGKVSENLNEQQEDYLWQRICALQNTIRSYQSRKISEDQLNDSYSEENVEKRRKSTKGRKGEGDCIGEELLFGEATKLLHRVFDYERYDRETEVLGVPMGIQLDAKEFFLYLLRAYMRKNNSQIDESNMHDSLRPLLQNENLLPILKTFNKVLLDEYKIYVNGDNALVKVEGNTIPFYEELPTSQVMLDFHNFHVFQHDNEYYLPLRIFLRLKLEKPSVEEKEGNILGRELTPGEIKVEDGEEYFMYGKYKFGVYTDGEKKRIISYKGKKVDDATFSYLGEKQRCFVYEMEEGERSHLLDLLSSTKVSMDNDTFTSVFQDLRQYYSTRKGLKTSQDLYDNLITSLFSKKAYVTEAEKVEIEKVTRGNKLYYTNAVGVEAKKSILDILYWSKQKLFRFDALASFNFELRRSTADAFFPKMDVPLEKYSYEKPKFDRRMLLQIFVDQLYTITALHGVKKVTLEKEYLEKRMSKIFEILLKQVCVPARYLKRPFKFAFDESEFDDHQDRKISLIKTISREKLIQRFNDNHDSDWLYTKIDEHMDSLAEDEDLDKSKLIDKIMNLYTERFDGISTADFEKIKEIISRRVSREFGKQSKIKNILEDPETRVKRMVYKLSKHFDFKAEKMDDDILRIKKKSSFLESYALNVNYKPILVNYLNGQVGAREVSLLNKYLLQWPYHFGGWKFIEDKANELQACFTMRNEGDTYVYSYDEPEAIKRRWVFLLTTSGQKFLKSFFRKGKLPTKKQIQDNIDNVALSNLCLHDLFYILRLWQHTKHMEEEAKKGGPFKTFDEMTSDEKEKLLLIPGNLKDTCRRVVEMWVEVYYLGDYLEENFLSLFESLDKLDLIRPGEWNERTFRQRISSRGFHCLKKINEGDHEKLKKMYLTRILLLGSIVAENQKTLPNCKMFLKFLECMIKSDVKEQIDKIRKADELVEATYRKGSNNNNAQKTRDMALKMYDKKVARRRHLLNALVLVYLKEVRSQIETLAYNDRLHRFCDAIATLNVALSLGWFGDDILSSDINQLLHLYFQKDVTEFGKYIRVTMQTGTSEVSEWIRCVHRSDDDKNDSLQFRMFSLCQYADINDDFHILNVGNWEELVKEQVTIQTLGTEGPELNSEKKFPSFNYVDYKCGKEDVTLLNPTLHHKEAMEEQTISSFQYMQMSDKTLTGISWHIKNGVNAVHIGSKWYLTFNNILGGVNESQRYGIKTFGKYFETQLMFTLFTQIYNVRHTDNKTEDDMRDFFIERLKLLKNPRGKKDLDKMHEEAKNRDTYEFNLSRSNYVVSLKNFHKILQDMHDQLRKLTKENRTQIPGYGEFEPKLKELLATLSKMLRRNKTLGVIKVFANFLHDDSTMATAKNTALMLLFNFATSKENDTSLKYQFADRVNNLLLAFQYRFYDRKNFTKIESLRTMINPKKNTEKFHDLYVKFEKFNFVLSLHRVFNHNWSIDTEFNGAITKLLKFLKTSVREKKNKKPLTYFIQFDKLEDEATSIILTLNSFLYYIRDIMDRGISIGERATRAVELFQQAIQNGGQFGPNKKKAQILDDQIKASRQSHDELKESLSEIAEEINKTVDTIQKLYLGEVTYIVEDNSKENLQNAIEEAREHTYIDEYISYLKEVYQADFDKEIPRMMFWLDKIQKELGSLLEELKTSENPFVDEDGYKYDKSELKKAAKNLNQAISAHIEYMSDKNNAWVKEVKKMKASQNNKTFINFCKNTLKDVNDDNIGAKIVACGERIDALKVNSQDFFCYEKTTTEYPKKRELIPFEVSNVHAELKKLLPRFRKIQGQIPLHYFKDKSETSRKFLRQITRIANLSGEGEIKKNVRDLIHKHKDELGEYWSIHFVFYDNKVRGELLIMNWFVKLQKLMKQVSVEKSSDVFQLCNYFVSIASKSYGKALAQEKFRAKKRESFRLLYNKLLDFDGSPNKELLEIISCFQSEIKEFGFDVNRQKLGPYFLEKVKALILPHLVDNPSLEILLLASYDTETLKTFNEEIAKDMYSSVRKKIHENIPTWQEDGKSRKYEFGVYYWNNGIKTMDSGKKRRVAFSPILVQHSRRKSSSQAATRRNTPMPTKRRKTTQESSLKSSRRKKGLKLSLNISKEELAQLKDIGSKVADLTALKKDFQNMKRDKLTGLQGDILDYNEAVFDKFEGLIYNIQVEKISRIEARIYNIQVENVSRKDFFKCVTKLNTFIHNFPLLKDTTLASLKTYLGDIEKLNAKLAKLAELGKLKYREANRYKSTYTDLKAILTSIQFGDFLWGDRKTLVDFLDGRMRETVLQLVAEGHEGSFLQKIEKSLAYEVPDNLLKIVCRNFSFFNLNGLGYKVNFEERNFTILNSGGPEEDFKSMSPGTEETFKNKIKSVLYRDKQFDELKKQFVDLIFNHLFQSGRGSHMYRITNILSSSALAGCRYCDRQVKDDIHSLIIPEDALELKSEVRECIDALETDISAQSI